MRRIRNRWRKRMRKMTWRRRRWWRWRTWEDKEINWRGKRKTVDMQLKKERSGVTLKTNSAYLIFAGVIESPQGGLTTTGQGPRHCPLVTRGRTETCLLISIPCFPELKPSQTNQEQSPWRVRWAFCPAFWWKEDALGLARPDAGDSLASLSGARGGLSMAGAI